MKLIILFTIIISVQVKADFTTGLIVGNLLSSSDTTIVKKDRFSMYVSQIQNKIKTEVSKHNAELKISVPADSGLYSYFKNEGYDVKKEEGSLLFNLSSKIITHKQEKKQGKEGLLRLLYLYLGIIGLAIFYVKVIATEDEDKSLPIVLSFIPILNILIGLSLLFILITYPFREKGIIGFFKG